MIPALVLLLVYNLCCAHAYAFDHERKDGIIGHDQLSKLLKRLDAKDDEIKELRRHQMRQEANINKLMMQIGEHDVNINELRKTLNEKDNAISQMDQNQKRQDEKMNELQYNVEKLQLENDQLRKSYPKCERKIQSLQAVMKKYMQRNKISQIVRQNKNSYYVDDEANPIGDTVERGFNKSTSASTVSLNRRDSDKKNRDDRRHAGTDIVAFFATLTSDVHNLGVGQNVKFDREITNIGAAYNPHAGAFFAPVSGTYVFMATLLSYYGHNSNFKVVHNGNVVCWLYVAGAAGTTHDTSAGSFVMYLEKGDMVTIQNYDSGESLRGAHSSFFSGFLLKEMEHNPSVVG